MDTCYSSYIKKIRAQQKLMITTLIGWSNQNSFTDNVEGLQRMLELLQHGFSSLGGAGKVIAIPPRKKIDQRGLLKRCTQGKALQIVKRPKAPIQILLAGHMDTVFPPENPFQTAKVKGERLCGPGVADMKGGLLVMLKALEALESSPWHKQIGWEVLITPDEEVGSCGSEPLYIKAAKKRQVGLIFEPSFPNGMLVSSRKGSSNIFVTVKGRSAHVGRDFSSGRNAVTALARWLLNVEQLNHTIKGVTVNVGEVQGGSAFNITPDTACAKVNIRVEEPEDVTTVEDCLKLLVEEANTQDGITLQIHTMAKRQPKPITEAGCHLFSLFQECAEDLNDTLKWKPTGGVCDGNILAEHGMPSLDTLGVIGGGLHTSDEYALIDSLPERASLTALFLLKLARGEITLPSKEQYQ